MYRNEDEENHFAQSEEIIQEISELLTGKKGLLDSKTPPKIIRKIAGDIAILSQSYRLTPGDAVGVTEQAHEKMKRQCPWFQGTPIAEQFDFAIQTADLACVLKTKNFRR